MAQQAALLSTRRRRGATRGRMPPAATGNRRRSTCTKYSCSVIGYYLYDEVTISKGGRCVLGHGRSGPPTHTLISLSPTDPRCTRCH